jgi:hypothetical protein
MKINTRENNNYNLSGIESFVSVINKLKKGKEKKEKKEGKNNSKTKKKSKLTFDDIVKEAEEIEPEKYSVDSLKKDFHNYINSFQKAKFENITGTTNEALDKFTFFKDKFFG